MNISKLIDLITQAVDIGIDVSHYHGEFIVSNCNERLFECSTIDEFDSWMKGYMACYKQMIGDE